MAALLEGKVALVTGAGHFAVASTASPGREFFTMAALTALSTAVWGGRTRNGRKLESERSGEGIVVVAFDEATGGEPFAWIGEPAPRKE